MAAANRSYETLLIEQIGRVVRVTLNRPERRNAISLTVRSELIDIVEAARRIRAQT